MITEIGKLRDVRERFRAFIKEREMVRVHKDLGIEPTTEDWILRDHHFCNINREHDRVTRWIDENVRKREDLDHSAMMCNVALCRVFNHPDALEGNVPYASIGELITRLNRRRENGLKVFRGAYMMVVHGQSGRGQNAINFYCELVRRIEKAKHPVFDSLYDFAGSITGVTGFGRFMANQMTTDMRYTRFYPRQTTLDWETFLMAGPGTIRGVRRWFRLDPQTGKWPNAKGCLGARQAADLVLRIRDSEDFGEPFNTYFIDPNNLSNCFCEFDKYERVLAIVPRGNESKGTLRKYKPHDRY